MFKVAALYQFAALPDFRELREPLRAFCVDLGIKGSILLAVEGVNGTIAAPAAARRGVVRELTTGVVFSGRLNHLALKSPRARLMPFLHRKVRKKKAIAPLGDPPTNPTGRPHVSTPVTC